MNRLIVILLFALQVTILPSIGAAAESCEACQRRARSVCALRCDKSKNRLEFDTCSTACVQRSCAERCVAKTSEQEDDTETETCADCVTRHEQIECMTSCDMYSPHASQCRRECAQKKCAKLCTMPDRGESRKAPQKSKYACDNCKMLAEQQCSLSTACAPDEPGTIACRFKCVQDRCAEDCLTDE